MIELNIFVTSKQKNTKYLNKLKITISTPPINVIKKVENKTVILKRHK